jgi:hypothetical protein
MRWWAGHRCTDPALGSRPLRHPAQWHRAEDLRQRTGAHAPKPAQQDGLQQILHAGWYLQGLITEILDLTAFESGSLL